MFQKIVKNAAFLKQYLLHARQTGSLIPSSNTLGFFMSEELLLSSELENKVVVELGGGDGVLSIKLARILAHIKGAKLFIVEVNPVFASILRKKLASFPHVEVLEVDACQLKNELLKHGVLKAHYIFSCLPFLSLKKDIRLKILEEIAFLMGKKSVFIMFSYTKLLLKQLKPNFNLQKQKYIFINFPPAYIFSFTRAYLAFFRVF